MKAPAAATLLVMLLLLPVLAAADTGIIVEYQNGTTDSFCLRTDRSVSGYDMMQKSKFGTEWSGESEFGRMLCKVNGAGTEVNGDFCEFKGNFWAIHLAKGSGWDFSPVGLVSKGSCWDGDFSSFGGHYCTKEGNVIALKFGDGSEKPASASFSDVCSQVLEIEKVTISADTKKETLFEGERISNLKPLSKLGFSVLVQNGGGEDLEDVEVELVIEGLNIEETESIGTLGEREDDEATFDEEVPDDAEDGTYAGHIIIAGTDSFGQVHRARRNFRIEVDREQHDLRITEANVQADCNGFASIGFTIANYGRSSEKEVRVNISGANSSGMVFQLDTDSERSGTIALLAGQGTQQVLLSVHDSKLKLNDEKSLPLQLPACVKDTSQLKKQQKEEITVVTFPKVEQEKTAKPEDGRASKLSRDGRLMLARLLAAYAAVMLLAVGAVLVLKKRDKKG